jgi:two-component system sensor histidine kinase GlrK
MASPSPVSLAMSLGGELRLIEDAQADVCFRLDLNVRPS